MLTKEQAEAEVIKHGTLAAAAKAHRVPRSTFQHWVKVGVKRITPPSSGKSLSDFREVYDKAFIVPQKIREGFSSLGDGWEYEVAFCKLIGVSLADLGNFRDQFAEHVVVIKSNGKRAWAGTPATAEKMRMMLR